jgi:hypothetical protein
MTASRTKQVLAWRHLVLNSFNSDHHQPDRRAAAAGPCVCSPVAVAEEPDTTTAGLTPSTDVALALSTDTAMPPLLASALLLLMAAPGPSVVAVLLATAMPLPAPLAVEVAMEGPPLLVAVALAMALDRSWRRRVLACIGARVVEAAEHRLASSMAGANNNSCNPGSHAVCWGTTQLGLQHLQG